jgi:aspartate/methionine/tyrosine aminotransferase
MFVWAPIPERFREAGSLEFSKKLLEKALVAVSPGIGFGPMGEGFVRFALGRKRPYASGRPPVHQTGPAMILAPANW